MIKNRKFIKSFNPEIKTYSEEYQEYFNQFDAGKENFTFNDFIQKEAKEYLTSGNGVTYLVFNSLSNGTKELISYFTLCVGAIPYIDRWKIPEEEREESGLEYDERYCGIPSVELKMFAVSEKYQDSFYKYEGEVKPISAWILELIIGKVYHMKTNMLGIKALFLHSVPEAESFYKRNGFDYILKPMNPFYCVDSELKAMYIAFADIDMHYDEWRFKIL